MKPETRKKLLEAQAAIESALAEAVDPVPVPVPPASKTLVALFGDANSLAAAEKSLNRAVDAITAYTDKKTLTSNTWPFTSQWPGSRKLALSHCLVPEGADMAAYAAGKFNSAYQTAANNLIPYRSRILAIRPGWEFNCPGIYAWCKGGPGSNQTPANYIGAFQQFARILKATLPEIPIDWCPLADNPQAEPWYPGDAFVDIIGVDQYMNSQYWNDDFNNTLTKMPNSLGWQEKFANAHGKLMSWPEWSTDFDTGTWVAKMSEWAARHAGKLLYHGYWDSDADFKSAFASHPVNKAAYVAWFGR
jgi:hypothetical protein